MENTFDIDVELMSLMYDIDEDIQANNDVFASVKRDDAYKGERRFPMGEFLKLKKQSFLLYAELQQISKWTEGEDHRYLKYYEINKTKMSKKLGMSKNTLDSKLKLLEESGMITIEEMNDIKYILLPNVGDYYVLVDLNIRFMKALLDEKNELLLRVMLFHKSYSEYVKRSKNESSYQVTLDYIADCVGWSKTHLQNIINMNTILEGFDVIKIDKSYEKSMKTGKVIERNVYTYLK